MAIRRNELWLGFFHGGVKVVDIVSGNSRTLKLTNSNRMAITKILADDDGEDVWIASYDHGLFRITAEEDAFLL